MATFTVHAPSGDPVADAAADRLVFVPEKASFLAFLVPFLWAPFNGLWWVFLGWIVATIAVESVGAIVSAPLGSILSAALAVWVGLSANDLKRWTLERRGARLVGVVEARDEDEAIVRFVAGLADPRRPRFGEVVEPARPAPDVPATGRPIPTPDLPTIVGWGSIERGQTP